MSRPFSVAVYCASSRRVDPVYFEAARELGAAIAARGWRLVFGGGTIGLMGEVARAVHAGGGQVFGVIPHSLDSVEVTYADCDELIFTETMRQRKALLEENSNAFIALPGGFGTLEEVSEIIVARQLGYTDHPLVLIDIDGYWQPLLAFFEQIEERGFASNIHALYTVVESIEEAMTIIETGGGVAHSPTAVPATRRGT